MRKMFLFLGLLLSLVTLNLCAPSSEAATVSSILNSKEPYVMVVYTAWSDLPSIRENVSRLESKYKSITFKMVNIGDSEARALFRKGPMTFATFPYIQMARGKVGSFVEPECARDYACFDRKIAKFFK